MNIYFMNYSRVVSILFMGFTPCKAEQLLRGMELQKKEAQKDYCIQEICLERTYS